MPATTDEKQRSGNEVDSNNPYQRGYDELFPAKSLSEAEQNAFNGIQERFGEPAINDGDRTGRGSHTDAHGDVVADNYNSSGSDRENVQQQEQSVGAAPSFTSNVGKEGAGSGPAGLFARLKSGSRRYGPTGGIVGVILGLFGITSVGLAPVSALTNLTTVVGNHSDMGNRLYQKTSYSFIGSFLAGDTRDCGTSKIKCKFTTISDSRKQAWEKRGIIVEADKSLIPGVTGERWKVRALVFPDGTRVQTLQQWNSLRYTNPNAYSLLKRFPLRASYLNTKSTLNKTIGRYGLSLADKFRSSTEKDKKDRKAANAESMNSKTGAVTGEDGKVTLAGIEGKDKGDQTASKMKDRFASAQKTLGVIGGASTPVVIACMGYDIIRATQAAMMLLWHEELIKFALPFMQAGSQAKEAGVNGDFDWETAEYYGDRLTTPITQKDIDADPEDTITQDMLGRTAMDSKGMAAALNGDAVINNNYSGWAPVNATLGAGIVKNIQNELGKDNIRTACTTAGYTAYLGLAGCASPPALVRCVVSVAVQQAVTRIWGDELVTLVAEQISEPAIKAIAKANLSDSLVGPPLGDAVVSAAGVMAENMDRMSGFAVATNSSQALNAYNDMSNDPDYRESKIAEARLEASRDQFDVTNQYSFAGQLLRRTAKIPSDGTLFSAFANTIGTVNALSAPTSASAIKQGIYQPIEIYQTPEKFNGALANCKNPGIEELMIPCVGESGRTIPVLLSPVRECVEQEGRGEKRDCIGEAIDYLSKRTYGDEGKTFIDTTTGEPDDWNDYKKENIDYDNPFLMFMRHCGGDRIFPIGYTDEAIDSENFDWYVGRNCAQGGEDKGFNDTDLAWGSFYYQQCIALYGSEEDVDYCWDDTAQPLASVTPNTGDWVIPTTGQCLSPYGPRWGKLHAGIDLSPPSGTPIVAPTSMKITSAGMNNGGYGNMVTGTATDGTNYSFRFGHMLSQPPVTVGQEVAKGTEIGKVGSTGDSTGPHLHFEIFPPGGNPATYSGAIDPVPILRENGVSVSC